MGGLGPLNAPCAIEGSSVAMGVTLFHGAYCFGTKLGLMGGVDEFIECGMRLGVGAHIGVLHSTKACTAMWSMV